MSQLDAPDASTSCTAALPGPARSPLAKQAARLLHKRLKIKVKDGRVLVGEFICLDRQGNIILTDCHEELLTGGKLIQKQMGQVIVPPAHRLTVEVEAMPGEAADLAALLETQARQPAEVAA